MSVVRRPNGRSPRQLRPLYISFDGLDRVDGSARFAFGDTKALASVSGPIEVRLAAEIASKATFEVMYRPLSGLPGTEAKLRAASIKSVLTPSLILTHTPRTLVHLVVQSLTTSRDADPSLVAACINASSLAFLSASSVPMTGVVCAVALGRHRDGNQLLVDPSDEEKTWLNGSGTFAFLFRSSRRGDASLASESVWTEWHGAPLDEQGVLTAREVAREAAEDIRVRLKSAIGRLAEGGPSSRQNFDPDADLHEDEAMVQADDDEAKMEIS